MLADYEQCREDERSYHSTLALVYTIAVGFLGAFTTYVISAKESIAPLALALAPMIPYALFAYLIPVGLLTTLRNHHSRALERDMRLLVSQGNSMDKSWVTLATSVQSLRLRRVSRFGALNAVGYSIMVTAALTVFGACLVYLGTQLDSPQLRSLMFALYVPMTIAILTALYVGSQQGKALYEFARRDRDSSVTSSASKSLSYFALPRPSDLVKTPYFVLGIWGGCLLSEATGDGLWSRRMAAALVAFLVLEVLTYQARYQWNDIRGAAEDDKHPHRAHRKRLLTTGIALGPAMTISTATMGLKLFVAVTIAFGDWAGTRNPLLLSIAMIVVVGVSYEAARSRGWAALTLFIVTLGYPVRVLAGMLVIGARPEDNPALFWSLAVSAMAFGLATVSITWALEGLDARVQGRRGDLKPHIALCVSSAGNVPDTAHTLAKRGSRLSIWNVGFFLTVVALSFGALWGAADPPPHWSSRFVAATLVFAGIAMLQANSTKVRLGLTIVLSAVALVDLAVHGSGVALLIWCASITYFSIYTIFRGTSYAEMTTLLERASTSLQNLAHRAWGLFVGTATAAQANTGARPRD